MEEKHILSSGATLTFFTDSSKQLPFIIVVPGGGYNHYGKKEQEAIALHFKNMGFNTALLHYTLTPFTFLQALADLAESVAFVRSNAKEAGAIENKITVLGFSAGGHLAGSLGAFWNTPVLPYALGKAEEQLHSFLPELYKPDSLCLCYPVITGDRQVCHHGTYEKLAENLNQEEAVKILKMTNTIGSGDSVPFWQELLRDAFSLDLHVTEDFPPVFMWHTREDQAVPAENTLRMAASLKKSGIDFEYHLFAKGPHGLALAPDTAAECWSRLFAEWLENRD